MGFFDFLQANRTTHTMLTEMRVLQGEVQVLSAAVQRLEELLKRLNRDVVTGPQEVQAALLKIYYLLHQTERLGEPPMRVEMLDEHANVLLPLDPVQQIELVIINPFQPEEYYARLILPGTYARADLLPPSNDGKHRQWSLHINVYQAPPQLVDALTLLQDKAYHCLFLGVRRRQSAMTYTVQYFPSTGLRKSQTPGEFPHDERLFFDALATPPARTYDAQQPPPAAGTEHHASE